MQRTTIAVVALALLAAVAVGIAGGRLAVGGASAEPTVVASPSGAATVPGA
ncbi:MAG: hypothetical protein QOJ59_1023 [Thermomicrobiales bacterium]|jgi:hypothetical protein|nr:hypothetical protein [Thermomicrobiales bacterium]